MKPDAISGKVTEVGDNSIQINEYGTLPIGKNFQAYRYQNKETEVKSASKDEIVVGYSATKFVVVDRQIVAAILTEKITPTTIRVLLMDSSHKSYYHKKVVISANSKFYIKDENNKIKWYKKGSKVTVSGQRLLASTEGKGKIKVHNINRGMGNPQYDGNLEITKKADGYLIVNEVSLEKYLYGVVPSEMPKSFGLEALKAQSICARSYGYQQILTNKLRGYGAHVDDSTNFQVYNNSNQVKVTKQAVDETTGMVAMSGDTVATTYFFSTSCGTTADGSQVWKTENKVPYLISKLQSDVASNTDLSNEKEFSDFIRKKEKAYDSKGPWFRWKCQISAKGIGEKLGIGTIKEIQIIKRGQGGTVLEAKAIGEKKILEMNTAYSVREKLGDPSICFERQDGSKVAGVSILPSGFFVLSKKGDTFTLFGGGYGHGVGMSQTGASALASTGKGYEAILKHYYPGTSLLKLY